MNRRLLGIPLAGLLLVGGTTAVLAESHGVEGVNGTIGQVVDRAGGVLQEVLDGLVEDGTLTREQADAVSDGVRARHEEIRSERQALREQLRGFLEDGTLSAEELAQLPEDHPLRNLDTYLEDGQLTEDELAQLWPIGRGHGPGPGPHGFLGPRAPSDGPVEPSTEETETPAATT